MIGRDRNMQFCSECKNTILSTVPGKRKNDQDTTEVMSMSPSNPNSKAQMFLGKGRLLNIDK